MRCCQVGDLSWCPKGGRFTRGPPRATGRWEVSVLTQTPSAVAMLPCEQLESMTLVVAGRPARQSWCSGGPHRGAS